MYQSPEGSVTVDAAENIVLNECLAVIVSTRGTDRKLYRDVCDCVESIDYSAIKATV